MIDEYYTFLIYGYHTNDLARCSDKEVVAVCEMCGEYRSSRFRAATELCMKCGHKNKRASDETRLKMSMAHIGINKTDEACIRMSCAKQHIKRNEWEGFTDKSRPHIKPISDCIKMNEWFKGSHAHHITKSIIIYIPKELHIHIWHNLITGHNMVEINMLSLQFINGTL